MNNKKISELSEEEVIALLDELLANKEIPSIDRHFKDIVEELTNDKEKLSILLLIVCLFSDGRYIRLQDKIAQMSIKYKQEKKMFILNIALDLLYYLGTTKYIKISKDLILIEIINEELANELALAKIKIKEKKTEFRDLSEQIDTIYDKYKDIKIKDIYDNTTTS